MTEQTTDRQGPAPLKPLRFGTSGLRALITEMTDMECYINTRGFIYFLEGLGEVGEGRKVALGGDLRSSTPRIMAAVKRAIQDQGLEVDYCGLVPSSALAYYAMARGIASIMVTGSHIPDDRNGIKFTKAAGEVLKSDEAAILKNVRKARDEVSSVPAPQSLFDERGMFKTEENLPHTTPDSLVLYKERYVKLFADPPLSGKRLVLYQHSAVGRDLVQEIFVALGAEVIPVARSEKFISVDTEKVSDETRQLLQEMAETYSPFAVISTDGDSDRPLLADAAGQFLPGDKLGSLAALFLKPDFVALPVTTNSSVVQALKSAGIPLTLTRIGSPYVIQAMIDQGNEDPTSKLAAWEVNGGFLTGSDWEINGKVLKALPTRDAVLPLLSALLLAIQEGKTVAELIAEKLPQRHTYAGAIDNMTPGCEAYTAQMGKKIIAMLSPRDSEIKQVAFNDGRIFTSATGQNFEEASPQRSTELKELKNKLSDLFSSDKGFGPISAVNFVDGIRVTFANNDIAHLRPSGNAPEFRLYAESDSLSTARETVAQKDRLVRELIERARQI